MCSLLEMQIWVPFALMLYYKNFVPLITIIIITYSEYVCVCVCVYYCLINPACKSRLFCSVLCCHLWPISLYLIFPHYHKNGTILGKKLLNTKCVLFFIQHLSETFLI